ncbi:reverse transcriptase [Trichonephila clavipes]|nr:reverse transcriptase [Trichonephila clavipes]
MHEAKSSEPEVPLTLRRVKIFITTYIDKSTTMTPRALESHGETLTTVGTIPRYLERAEAHFRLTTGHYFLEVYLHWLLTRHAHSARRDSDHCSDELDEHPTDDVVNRYFDSQRQMAKKSSTWVG